MLFVRYGLQPASQKPPLGAGIDWDHPLSAGLVRCWVLNEGAGMLTRDLAGGSGNRLTVFTAAASGWKPRTAGTALAFDGANDYVDCGSSMPSLQDSTVFAQIQTTTIAATAVVIGRGLTSGDHTHALVISSGKATYQSASGIMFQPADGVTGIISVNDGKVHTIAGTFDGTLLAVHVDGYLDASKNKTTYPTKNITNTVLGNLIGYSVYFSGFISAVYAYDRALPQDQLRWLHAEPYAMIRPAELPSKLFTMSSLAQTFRARELPARFAPKELVDRYTMVEK